MRQAELLARYLSSESLDAVYSSPMRRAQQTAAPVAKSLNLDVTLIDGVAEFDRHSEWYVPVEELKAANDPRWHELLSGELTDELLLLLEQRGILLFPQLNLTDPEQVAFTNALGGNASADSYLRIDKLLAAAGYPNGFSTDLWAMPVQRPYNPNAKRIAELMQADLAKVGVKAEIKSFEWGEYRKRMQAGEHQMGMLGWTGDNGDPDNFLNTLLGCSSAKQNGSNVAKFCYKPFEDLVQKAKVVSNPAERTKLYEKAQVIFKEQAPWFTIAHAVQLKPVRKEVVDFKLSPFGRHTFYGVDIK